MRSLTFPLPLSLSLCPVSLSLSSVLCSLSSFLCPLSHTLSCALSVKDNSKSPGATQILHQLGPDPLVALCDGEASIGSPGASLWPWLAQVVCGGVGSPEQLLEGPHQDGAHLLDLRFVEGPLGQGCAEEPQRRPCDMTLSEGLACVMTPSAKDYHMTSCLKEHLGTRHHMIEPQACCATHQCPGSCTGRTKRPPQLKSIPVAQMSPQPSYRKLGPQRRCSPSWCTGLHLREVSKGPEKPSDPKEPALQGAP